MSDSQSLLGGEQGTKYNSRVGRARAANQKRRQDRLISFGPHDFVAEPTDSLGGEPESPSSGVAALSMTSPKPTPLERQETPIGSLSKAAPQVVDPAAASAPKAAADTMIPATNETGVQWHWNDAAKLLAMTDRSQVLRVLNAEGRLIYRVQLPPEGRTILLGWEPSGAVLAVVQKLGGAFLWFPSKPESVQQWEGMQFSSSLMRNSVLQRNSHFDTDFACWSEAGKLVLGLADGNFACWDLASNETFMSRKHFSGKLKSGVTCGAWGPRGEILAIGSHNQLKVSKPMSSASWENTAAKLYQPNKELRFQKISFSPEGGSLAALAGTSVFAHLCIYDVKPDEKKGHAVLPVAEMHPDPSVGAIQSFLWLNESVLAAVMRSSDVRLLMRDDEGLLEEQHAGSPSGGAVCATLVNGYIVIATSSGMVSFFSPADRAIAHSATLPITTEAYPSTLQMTDKSMLLVGLTDGTVMKMKLPTLPPVDLGGLRVIHKDEDDEAKASSGSRPRFESISPTFVMKIPPGEAFGAPDRPLKFDFSTSQQMLAVVNAGGKLLVRKAASDEGAEEDVLQAQLPDGACIDVEWEPGMEAQLSCAVRGQGAVLWRAGTDEGVQMWSGMKYKNPLVTFTSSHKEFDPLVQSWSAAGQLVLGMSDGSFAVWDSLTSQTFASMRSGKHKTGITSASWLPSLFAPALALGSTSTIKVSQGFDSVEWSATAMKLKLKGGSNNKSGRISSAMAGAAHMAMMKMSRQKSRSSFGSPGNKDMFPGEITPGTPGSMTSSEGGDGQTAEGLNFTALEFSPSGKMLASLAVPSDAPGDKMVCIYELHDQRSALVLLRTISASEEDGTPSGFAWQPDDGLLIFMSTRQGGGVVAVAPRRRAMMDASYPPAGVEPPGTMVDAAATARGLIALAFVPKSGSGGIVQLLSPAPLKLLAELPLEGTPTSIKLKGVPGGEHYLTVGFEQGGVEVWSLVPDAE